MLVPIALLLALAPPLPLPLAVLPYPGVLAPQRKGWGCPPLPGTHWLRDAHPGLPRLSPTSTCIAIPNSTCIAIPNSACSHDPDSSQALI